MLIFNKRDGTVETFDLENDSLDSKVGDPAWHRQVTGVSLVGDGQRTDLSLPKNFGPVTYAGEIVMDGDKSVAERVSASAGETLITLTRYLNGQNGRFRVDVTKPGKLRWRRS